MSEPTWVPTGAPPLRSDIDRRLRALRRAERSLRRVLGFCAVGLLGVAVGTLAAIQPENFV